MIKKKLLEMPPLPATQTMLRAAKEDRKIRRKVNYGTYSYTTEARKYGAYFRCIVQGDILKIAAFQPSALRRGVRTPAFEIYIDCAHEKFITYVPAENKWRASMLSNLPIYTWLHNSMGEWVAPVDKHRILSALGKRESAFQSILQYQRHIRELELDARHERKIAPWVKENAQVPSVPRDWTRWIDKVGIPEQFIFYQYKRGGAKTGYCSYCEKEVPIHAPRHGKTGRCPCCRKEITFKAFGKVGFLCTEDYYVHLLQKVDSGFVVRLFVAWRRQSRSEYLTPTIVCNEIRRSFYTSDGRMLSAYYRDLYKNWKVCWIKDELRSVNSFRRFNGRVYGKTIPRLDKAGMARTGLSRQLIPGESIDVELQLARYNRELHLEMLHKANLPILEQECRAQSGIYESIFHSIAPGPLTKMLGVDSQRLKRLRACKGGYTFLGWLKYEKQRNLSIPDSDIKWMAKNHVHFDDIRFILDRMSIVQVCNYMRRQMKKYNLSTYQMLSTWRDYLRLAHNLGYDVNDEIVYRTSKLRQRHDELVEKIRLKDRAERAAPLLKKYPHADDICKTLQSKYGYAGEAYTVIAPEGIIDILEEGDALHHCMSGSDVYIERIEKHETYILFIRKTKGLDVHYYTMEIEPDGTVRQIRTMFNRQEKDISQVRAFVKQWQKEIAPNLSDEDRARAEQSRLLREQEFVQMRQDRITIHTGDLAGKLLADVLAADLMQAA